MNKRTRMKIKIITNSGFKYEGEKISEDSLFIRIDDDKQGKISVPLANVSLIKNLEDFDNE